MNLNLGCGAGPVLNNDFTYIDGSRKLLLVKMGVPTSILNIVSNENAKWDRKVKFRNIVKIYFRENSLDNIYTSHLLEHLYFEESLALIRRINQAQISGGILRIALPDYDSFIDRYISDRESKPIEAILEFENSLIGHPLARPKLLEKIKSAIVGDLHSHKWHPTYSLLADMLNKAGYSNFKRRNYLDSDIPNIEKLEFRSEYTFFIEATKG